MSYRSERSPFQDTASSVTGQVIGATVEGIVGGSQRLSIVEGSTVWVQKIRHVLQRKKA